MKDETTSKYCGTQALDIKEPLMEDVLSKLNILFYQVISIENSLVKFNAKLYGTNPTCEKGSCAPVPNGLAGKIEEKISHLTSAVNRLGEEVFSLNKIA